MVTVPTIDQISGTTVMNKLRDLIRKFIQFATEVDEDITVNIPDYVQTYVSSALEDYYTKIQVDNLFTSYYTKTQVDNLLVAKQDTLHAGLPLYMTTIDDYSYVELGYVSGKLKITSNKLDINTDMIVRSMTVDAPLYKERGNVGEEVDALGINIDNDTIKINSDNELYADITPGQVLSSGFNINIDSNNK